MSDPSWKDAARHVGRMSLAELSMLADGLSATHPLASAGRAGLWRERAATERAERHRRVVSLANAVAAIGSTQRPEGRRQYRRPKRSLICDTTTGQRYASVLAAREATGVSRTSIYAAMNADGRFRVVDRSEAA